MIIQYENKNYDLAELHTKQLMNILRELRVSFCECCYDSVWVEEQWKLKRILIPIIKEELSKREHIPNKKEAKLIRKEKAIHQKDRNNQKYRNR